MANNTEKPANQFARIISLLRTGPKALFLRFFDQYTRKFTGAPVWRLSRITAQVYVGGQHYTKGWSHMEKEGISAVLNMREAVYDDVANAIGGDTHLHLATQDNTPVPMAYLHQAADFIHEQQQGGGKVYIHCGVGVGRAPSAGAAYFIKYEGLTTVQALAKIRDVRPFIHLTGKQRQQLEAFEFEVNQQAVTDNS